MKFIILQIKIMLLGVLIFHLTHLKTSHSLINILETIKNLNSKIKSFKGFILKTLVLILKKKNKMKILLLILKVFMQFRKSLVIICANSIETYIT